MSIADIAERAGVSPSTVSLVINGKPSVAPATAAAVREVIREMGYTPPPLERRQGRRVVREATARVAVVAQMPGQWLQSPVFGEVLEGLEIRAREEKSVMSLYKVPNDSAANLEMMEDELAGLILFGGHPTPEWLGKLAQLPCVRVMGTPDEDAWCDHVTYKNSSIGHLAARHLLEQGHRHVACLCLGTNEVILGREASFMAAIKTGGGTAARLEAAGIILMTEDDQTIDTALLGRLLDQLLQTDPRPTGLFLPVDMAAPPVYLQLLQRGVRPGKDVEIVSCNNERSLLNGLEPRPAVVDIHAREVGRRAMERLLWRVKHPKAPPADILIHPVLVKAR